MAITTHRRPDSIMFLLMGMPFSIPSEFVQSERQMIHNDIQQNMNPKFEPSLRFSTSSVLVDIMIPSQLDFFYSGFNRVLKSTLKMLCESLASETYANVNELGQVPIDSVGKIVSPFSKIRDPSDPQAKLIRGDIGPLLVTYIGHTHHVLNGYLRSFSSNLSPDKGVEIWNIDMENANYTTLRQSRPVQTGVPSIEDSSVYKLPNHGSAPVVGRY